MSKRDEEACIYNIFHGSGRRQGAGDWLYGFPDRFHLGKSGQTLQKQSGEKAVDQIIHVRRDQNAVERDIGGRGDRHHSSGEFHHAPLIDSSVMISIYQLTE